MQKFRVLLLPFALIVWIFTTLLFVNYSKDVYGEFQEEKLDIIVNYAVDAAIDEMVQTTPDLGLDYVDFEFMNVDPKVALDMFCVVFCKGYGMSLSEQNIALVKSRYLPTFCVAAYDGYYIGEPVQINEGGAFDIIFTLKQPYLYQDNSELYALNLGLNDSQRFENSILERVDAPLSKASQLQVINAAVSDSVMASVYRQKDKNILSTVYVPSSLTNIVRTNPIENVTVLAYVSNIPLGFGESYETLGIGGAKVTHERFCVGYVKNGKKYYMYSDEFNDMTLTAEEVFENPMRAAEAGYYFDYDYFKH